MNKVDIFEFNFFKKNKLKTKHVFFEKNLDIFLSIIAFLFGMIGFKSIFDYFNKGIIPYDSYLSLLMLIWGFIIFSIYSPIMYYITQQFYTRLVIFSYKNSRNELFIYLRNKQRVKISHYEIIDDWRPYFLTFNLFIHKLEYYENHWLIVEENTKYYTIKDLDTGILYLYCVNKEQYLNALEQENTENSIRSV